MPGVSLHDKDEIQRHLRENVYLHIYSIGDLDDFFWPHTIWFGRRTAQRLDAIALLYIGQSTPTLLALTERPDPMELLLKSIEQLLPSCFHAHLSPGLESVLAGAFDVSAHGEHYKMALVDDTVVVDFDCSRACPLSVSHLDEIRDVYARSYPDNWFDPRMLETGQYFGIREGESLVSVAGVHVYSSEYQVAALGNIATLPEHRGKGFARRVTAAVCQSLLRSGVRHIGLNVKADNRAAVACYKRLGFDVASSYGEFYCKRL